MSSNYNGVPRPAAVLVHDGEARLIRRRETVDDLLARAWVLLEQLESATGQPIDLGRAGSLTSTMLKP